MGQAKLKGNRDIRVDAAKARALALLPEKLVCDDCSSDVTELHIMDSRGIAGLDLACAGVCPNCKGTVWGFKGDPDVIKEVARTFNETLLSQTVKPLL